MTVVDASALIAILLREPEGRQFTEFLSTRPGAMMSPVSYWEAATRLRGLHGDAGIRDLDQVIEQLKIVIAPAGERTSKIASEAEGRFGKRTPARLNLGDCFAYALSRELDAPLLYKGEDFARTDVRSARAI